jgi:hypothetical protein
VGAGARSLSEAPFSTAMHDLDNNGDVKMLRNALKEQWKPGAAKTRVLGVFRGTFSLEGKKRFLKVAKVEKVEVNAR